MFVSRNDETYTFMTLQRPFAFGVFSPSNRRFSLIQPVTLCRVQPFGICGSANRADKVRTRSKIPSFYCCLARCDPFHEQHMELPRQCLIPLCRESR